MTARERLFAPLPRGLNLTVSGLVVATIALTARAVALISPVTLHPRTLTAAATFDLTITTSLVVWWILRREFGWSLRALATLLAGTATLAGFVLPAAQQGPLRFAQLAIAPVEVALIIYLIHRVVRARRNQVGDPESPTDPRAIILAGAKSVAGEGRFAEILADEISVLYFALAARPAVERASLPEGDCAGGHRRNDRWFTYHRKAAYGGVVFAFVLISLAEIPALHLLLGLWSDRLAWLVTALGAYGMLWLIGDWRATRNLPILVRGEDLHIRFGLRWRIDIALDDIVAFRSPTAAERSRKKLVDLKLALPMSRWKVLELKRPVEARGIYGRRRTVRTLGLAIDEQDRFDTLLADSSAISD